MLASIFRGVSGIVLLLMALVPATAEGQELFNRTGGEPFSQQTIGGTATLRWSFGLELKKGEAE